ncbi:SubName: Full=Uncharacterized protein {ECO:0000313/EMBL:CCA74754.1} [Serendipita indica DSM 11827]|nr:SubName: Full=Uncharacterized protein {ECO:0000313/EMBL:CCA74754.1} [Serendipita indica DSM 11827]
MIPKEFARDTQIITFDANGQETPVPVPTGTDILLNVVALHNNPKYWDDPYTFRPERFLGDYNRYAWLPFSACPRACIGRRFAEVEMLAVLALIVQRYEITPAHKPEFVHETEKERQARLTDIGKVSFVIQAQNVGLTLQRRDLEHL